MEQQKASITELEASTTEQEENVQVLQNGDVSPDQEEPRSTESELASTCLKSERQQSMESPAAAQQLPA